MTKIFAIRLLLIFAIAFSLSSLPGVFSGSLPGHVAKADLVAPAEKWYPAGPAMDTEQVTIFQDETNEFANLNAKAIDLTDWPLFTADIPGKVAPGSGFLVTQQINDHGYFELQFLQANTFWGCNFDYGNSQCGIDIRQGIAHLIDRKSFSANQANIKPATPIDNPEPAAETFKNVALATPNTCSWDVKFPQPAADPGCVVSGAGGTAYHLQNAPPIPPPPGDGRFFAWQQLVGSQDFCAAADHFIAAIPGTAKNPTSCVVSGVPIAAKVDFFVRSDHNPRFELGTSIAGSVCALFTGSYAPNCPQITFTPGTIVSFPGFSTDPLRVALTWHVYTAGFGNVFPFDAPIFFGYHSQFVDAANDRGTPAVPSSSVWVKNGGKCDNRAVSSNGPSNYQYICVASYDTQSTQMEFAPCLTAPGDPVAGTASPTFANCPGTTTSTSISAAYKALDIFGKNVLTLPVFSVKSQFGYLNNWQRGINHEGNGLANFFTWLDAYSPNPATPGTIRQGFKQTTRSMSPYNLLTVWDLFMQGNIYDSLNVPNPLKNGELMEWMTKTSKIVPPAGLGYVPPVGTVASFRFTLRDDIYWQDACKTPVPGTFQPGCAGADLRQVTAWDVKFSYATLLAQGTAQGSGLAAMVCNTPTCVDGITVQDKTHFDVHVNAVGEYVKFSITGPTIIPGRLWSVPACTGAAWEGFVQAGNVPDICMDVPATRLAPTFDPICPLGGCQPNNVAQGMMIGSSAWECVNLNVVATKQVGSGCSSTGRMNPGNAGSYTLKRSGLGRDPGSSLFDDYFRSSGSLALWLWSGNNGDFTHDFLNFGIVAKCFGVAHDLLGGIPATNSCAHFQQGIGGIVAGSPSDVGQIQIGLVLRFLGVNWVEPFNLTNNVPTGLVWGGPGAPTLPTLYAGSVTLRPASVANCNPPFSPTAAISGGYDC